MHHPSADAPSSKFKFKFMTSAKERQVPGTGWVQITQKGLAELFLVGSWREVRVGVSHKLNLLDF